MIKIANIRMTPDIMNRRIRGNKWDALCRALDDVILDPDYPIDLPEIIKCIQASLTTRLGLITDEFSPLHINIQEDVNILDAVGGSIDRNHEIDSMKTRKVKLLLLQAAILKLQATQ